MASTIASETTQKAVSSISGLSAMPVSEFLETAPATTFESVFPPVSATISAMLTETANTSDVSHDRSPAGIKVSIITGTFAGIALLVAGAWYILWYRGRDGIQSHQGKRSFGASQNTLLNRLKLNPSRVIGLQPENNIQAPVIAAGSNSPRTPLTNRIAGNGLAPLSSSITRPVTQTSGGVISTGLTSLPPRKKLTRRQLPVFSRAVTPSSERIPAPPSTKDSSGTPPKAPFSRSGLSAIPIAPPVAADGVRLCSLSIPPPAALPSGLPAILPGDLPAVSSAALPKTSAPVVATPRPARLGISPKVPTLPLPPQARSKSALARDFPLPAGSKPPLAGHTTPQAGSKPALAPLFPPPAGPISLAGHTTPQAGSKPALAPLFPPPAGSKPAPAGPISLAPSVLPQAGSKSASASAFPPPAGHTTPQAGSKPALAPLFPPPARSKPAPAVAFPPPVGSRPAPAPLLPPPAGSKAASALAFPPPVGSRPAPAPHLPPPAGSKAASALPFPPPVGPRSAPAPLLPPAGSKPAPAPPFPPPVGPRPVPAGHISLATSGLPQPGSKPAPAPLPPPPTASKPAPAPPFPPTGSKPVPALAFPPAGSKPAPAPLPPPPTASKPAPAPPFPPPAGSKPVPALAFPPTASKAVPASAFPPPAGPRPIPAPPFPPAGSKPAPAPPFPPAGSKPAPAPPFPPPAGSKPVPALAFPPAGSKPALAPPFPPPARSKPAPAPPFPPPSGPISLPAPTVPPPGPLGARPADLPDSRRNNLPDLSSATPPFNLHQSTAVPLHNPLPNHAISSLKPKPPILNQRPGSPSNSQHGHQALKRIEDKERKPSQPPDKPPQLRSFDIIIGPLTAGFTFVLTPNQTSNSTTPTTGVITTLSKLHMQARFHFHRRLPTLPTQEKHTQSPNGISVQFDRSYSNDPIKKLTAKEFAARILVKDVILNAGIRQLELKDCTLDEFKLFNSELNQADQLQEIQRPGKKQQESQKHKSKKDDQQQGRQEEKSQRVLEVREPEAGELGAGQSEEREGKQPRGQEPEREPEAGKLSGEEAHGLRA
ncbi:hypothetical protein CFIMG_008055RA00001 [Ceratocystis fimbriata CBS 114723]|uniref:Uncharacterized protein n=1 Tax=Ceratocystis fimbriata CBS 114723 TaxID=1035309 RepID=A0A2C5X8V6_9PEZI|nr:hypothetical protein CFIMG_008055RA00001 [Ceratocystis fimbriata CBS 114723]